MARVCRQCDGGAAGFVGGFVGGECAGSNLTIKPQAEPVALHITCSHCIHKDSQQALGIQPKSYRRQTIS